MASQHIAALDSWVLTAIDGFEWAISTQSSDARCWHSSQFSSGISRFILKSLIKTGPVEADGT